MIKAIIYQSKTGHTKEYAKSLSKELKIPCYSVQDAKEKVNKKDCTIRDESQSNIP